MEIWFTIVTLKYWPNVPSTSTLYINLRNVYEKTKAQYFISTKTENFVWNLKLSFTSIRHILRVVTPPSRQNVTQTSVTLQKSVTFQRASDKSCLKMIFIGPELSLWKDSIRMEKELLITSLEPLGQNLVRNPLQSSLTQAAWTVSH